VLGQEPRFEISKPKFENHCCLATTVATLPPGKNRLFFQQLFIENLLCIRPPGPNAGETVILRLAESALRELAFQWGKQI
jgi:hypothetical protein